MSKRIEGSRPERWLEERAIVRQRRDYTLFSSAVRADVELLQARYVVVHDTRRETETPITFFLFHVLIVDEDLGLILADRDVGFTVDGAHPAEPTRLDVELVVERVLDELVQIDRRLARRLDFDAQSGAINMTWDEKRKMPPEVSRQRGFEGLATRSKATRADRLRIARLMSLATSPALFEAQVARAKATELLKRFGLRAADIAREFRIYRPSED